MPVSVSEIRGRESGTWIGFSVSTFLSAFAKLRKATISFVMSVCQSVRMQQLGNHWTDFDET
jgi:hypothetical protein